MAAILSQYGTTGFYKAPVSKGLLGTVILTSCALNVPLFSHVKQYMIFSIPAIFEKYELWRLLTSQLTFLDTKQVVCGSLLIYYFRVFERRYGSHKFASYLLSAYTVTTLLELAFIYALRKLDMQISYLPAGPFGLIFPLFINYFVDIPRVAQSYIMGIPITGKTFTYLLGLQILGSSKEALITSLCALCAGLVCRAAGSWLQIPHALAKVSSSTLGWILASSPPQHDTPLGATLEIQRMQHMELLEQQMLLSQARQNHRTRQQMAQGYAERLVPASEAAQNHTSFWNNSFFLRRRNPGVESEPTPPMNHSEDQPGPSGLQSSPPEEQVQTLVEMGFDRQSVVRALRHSNNDINVATTILLSET